MMNPNKVLTNEDRVLYKDTIDKMFELCPDMMSRKIPEANVQQAFVFEYIAQHYAKEARMLCVGSFEDTACESLKALGFSNIVEIDPAINYGLHEFWAQNSGSSFEVIFATSVLEHVTDDELFISQICDLLQSGGVGILTCDFNEDYKKGVVPATVVRQYTKHDLDVRLRVIMEAKGCSYGSKPDWVGKKEFHYQGHDYDFATMVFRKVV